MSSDPMMALKNDLPGLDDESCQASLPSRLRTAARSPTPAAWQREPLRDSFTARLVFGGILRPNFAMEAILKALDELYKIFLIGS